MNGSDVVDPLYDRILGRVLAEDLVDLKSGNVLVAAGQMVTEEHAEAIGSSGVDQALIRSALLCEAEKGICGNCYGRDLARGTEVNIGEAVGVIAAQSIGEPGTQLTMRTFHVGGAAQRGAEQSNIEANIGGVVKLEDASLVVDKTGSNIVMSRNTELLILMSKSVSGHASVCLMVVNCWSKTGRKLRLVPF
jgi:DNA-directed RNA polymerase subunit beta'